MSLRLILLAGAVAAGPAAVAAQTPVDQLVVTASRVGLNATTSPYSIAVIPQAELTARNSVADALGGISDIYVQAPGGRAGASSIFLRGADPNFTALLFDGVQLNDPTNTRGGAVNVSEINAAGLERIEVVSGALSGLYGSGALAGAVNLVVPGGAPTPQGSVTAGAGSRDFWTATAMVRGPLAMGLGGSLSLNADNDGEQTPGSRFRSRTLTAKVAPLEGEDAGRLIVRLGERYARTFPDSSGGARLATRRGLDVRKSRDQLAGLSLPVYRGDAARLDVSGSILHRRDDTTSPGVAPSMFNPSGVPAGEDHTHYTRAIAAAVSRATLGDVELAVGAEFQREDGRNAGKLNFGGFSAPNSFDLSRDTVSGFIEADRSAGALSLNGGLRVDDVEGLSARVTGRAGARYDLGSGLSLKAAAATGFKAPSFYALANPFVGNRDLKPETSKGGELGLAWAGAPGDTASVTLFYSRYKDLIDFIPGPPPRLENRNLVVSKGVSATATHALSATLAASVQVQYAQTEDDATGVQLLNRPRWRVNAGVTWTPTDALRFAVRHAYVGDRDDFATPVGPGTMSGYNAVSVEAAWTFLPATTARIVVDNALDDDHEDALGFPAPKIGARLYLSRTF